jgi:hypothetical protein
MFSAVLCSGCRGTRERSLAELLKVEEAAPFTERRLARKEKCTLQRLPHDLEGEACGDFTRLPPRMRSDMAGHEACLAMVG